MLKKNREAEASILSKISHIKFTKAENAIIEYFLSVSEYDIALITIKSLNQITSTGRSTIDRLSSKLGFKGFKEFKSQLLYESQFMHSTISQSIFEKKTIPSIIESDTYSEIANKIFKNASIRSLKFADMLAKTLQLTKLVKLLENSNRIEVFGEGASGVVCQDMYQRLLRLGLNINYSESYHEKIAHASLMTNKDLAIGISYSGKTKTTVKAIEICKSRGAKIAFILGSNIDKITLLSDVVIFTPPGIKSYAASPVMNRILEMMFNEVLFHCLVQKNPDMHNRVKNIEKTLNEERMN